MPKSRASWKICPCDCSERCGARFFDRNCRVVSLKSATRPLGHTARYPVSVVVRLS